jgi:menaquinone-dependent protoporphyrinogen oxidase
MRIAIIYATKYGTTEEVARLIAAQLIGSNAVELVSLKENPSPDISGYEIMILGTPIYASQPNKKMKTFCKSNESLLLQKKTALFVCGMEPDPSKREKELLDAYSEELRNKASTTRFLGGAFLFEKMNFAERFIIKKIANTQQTVHRILQEEIDAFVKQIQNEL